MAIAALVGHSYHGSLFLYNSGKHNSDVVFYKMKRFNHLDGSVIYSAPAFDFANIFPDEDFNNFVFTYHDVKNYVMNTSFSPVLKLFKKDFLNSYDDFLFLENLRYEDIPFHIQVMLRAKMSFCPHFLYNYRISNKTSLINSSHDEKVHDIFKIIEIVEEFLKENQYFEEFEVEFNKFRFIQIIQYVLPSKSDFYFDEAKKELKNLKFNFDADIFNKIQYNNLISSRDFMDYYDQLFDDIKNRFLKSSSDVAEKNRLLSVKNEEISKKDKEISSKDSVISDLNGAIESKDSVISEKNTIIDNNNLLIDKLSNIIDSNDIHINQQDSKIIEKEQIISDLVKEINQKRNTIDEKEKNLKLLNEDLASKLKIIDHYEKEIKELVSKISLLEDNILDLNKKLDSELHENLKLKMQLESISK